MIATLVRLTGLSPLVLKLAGVVLCFALFVAAYIAGEAKGTRNERARNTVALLKAEAAIRKAETAARDMADELARAREQQNAQDTEELHEAAKQGTNDRAGPGIAAVIERVRQQQSRGRSD